MSLAIDLAVRDLTDPAQGPHAIQTIVQAVLDAATARWPDAELVVHRGERIVDVADNYDRLGYSPEAAARDSRYTRYVDEKRMLRSQTSALIPGALRELTAGEALIACPGIVYRRDSIDRLHTGTPHQLDLWRVTRGPAELIELVAVAMTAALPGTPWRVHPATHPYTTDGLEIEAWSGEAWVEVGECGMAARHLCDGLALGLGLDRLLMLRKGIDDIRLLRSDDPRVSGQMTDLTPYRPVSAQPAARRDLSVALPAGVTAEDLGDRVRELLGADAHLVEEVTIESATPPEELPAASRERLGIVDGEVNVLLRVVLRDLHRALPRQRVNGLRDRLYEGLMARSSPSMTVTAWPVRWVRSPRSETRTRPPRAEAW
jgi:phenylalanyl-tRNA synthetase alpha chain